MRLTRLQFLVCAGAVLLPIPTAAATLTITASADTALFENAPNNNLGVVAFMPIGRTDDGDQNRGLLRFDLSGIPQNAVLSNATLSLSIGERDQGLGSVALHRMRVPWTEGRGSGGPNGSGTIGSAALSGESTWNRRAHNSTGWAAPGAGAGSDFESSPSAAAARSGAYSLTGAGVLNDVKLWLTNGSSNFGWLIKAANESSGGATRIRSREATSGRPTLTVVYGLPTATLSITTDSQLPHAFQGQTYQLAFAATGGRSPYTWAISSGQLPSGLTLGRDGVLSGTPAAIGSFTLGLQVGDATGASTKKSFSIGILPRPQLEDPAVTNEVFSFRFSALAAANYTVEFSNSELLPAWQSLSNLPNSSGTAVFSEPLTATNRFYRLRVR